MLMRYMNQEELEAIADIHSSDILLSISRRNFLQVKLQILIIHITCY